MFESRQQFTEAFDFREPKNTVRGLAFHPLPYPTSAPPVLHCRVSDHVTDLEFVGCEPGRLKLRSGPLDSRSSYDKNFLMVALWNYGGKCTFTFDRKRA
ncbi:hypothetical protein D5086_004232 [Populus alba]|uniref:Uncharacterized protein n=1 Tax=Populus alba TaxID=43335 RepID=A0ACC4CPW6_POPAL